MTWINLFSTPLAIGKIVKLTGFFGLGLAISLEEEKLNSNQLHFAGKLVGSGRGQGELCCRLISDSILRLFYFTPRCLVDVTPWTRRPKKIIRKKTATDRRRRYFFIFPLFPGFNNHSMGEGIFPEYNWNDWIPQSRCLKIRLTFLGICVSFFGILKL